VNRHINKKAKQKACNSHMNWMGGARKKNGALETKRDTEEARQRYVYNMSPEPRHGFRISKQMFFFEDLQDDHRDQ
jgi:hypothetical protein